MKAVLKYPGAKNRLASWICGYIPEHKVYLEPYAGSLAVLFNKPRSHIETVNDLDGNITNFFKVLRDNADELIAKIKLTPFSRREYKDAYENCSNSETEQARVFAVKCWMGFGCGNLYQNGFKSGQQSRSPNPARAWSKLQETLEQATERLKGVQIENLPAVELIKRYNTEDVFMHYDNELYNGMLPGWKKVYKDTQAEFGLKRQEVLWMNYDIGQMTLKTAEEYADMPTPMPAT